MPTFALPNSRVGFGVFSPPYACRQQASAITRHHRNVRRRARLAGARNGKAFSRRARARVFVHERHDLPPGNKEGGGAPKGHVARMSVSEVRGGHSSFQLVPGFHGACHRAGHFGPDPLVHPGYKFIRLQRREAERRQTRISNLRTLNLHPPRLRGGQRRGRGARPSGRARLSAFHRGTCLGEPTPPLSSSYALPGTRP